MDLEEIYNTYIHNQNYIFNYTYPLYKSRKRLSYLGKWVLDKLSKGCSHIPSRVRMLALLGSDEQIIVLHLLSVRYFGYRVCNRHDYKILTDYEKAIIQQLRLLSVPYNRIASILNRHVSTIYYYCKRLNDGKEQNYFGD